MPNPTEILFLTSNANKFEEAKRILKPFGINLSTSSSKGDEIQSDSVELVARRSAENAYKKIGKPLFVEDSGLYIDALSGFPGAFSAYVYDKLGCEGILRLLDQQRQRSARFECAIAYADKRGVRTFTGTVHGKIASKAFGGKGFGYDPIFVPEGQEKPFSLIPGLKAEISHRAIALKKMAGYLAVKRRN